MAAPPRAWAEPQGGGSSWVCREGRGRRAPGRAPRRTKGSGTRSRRARGGEGTCQRPCARPADSQAEPAWGRAGRQLTRPRRTWHHCPSVSSKEDHRLALRFRIVLESGLFISKEIIKSHVQKLGWGKKRERGGNWGQLTQGPGKVTAERRWGEGGRRKRTGFLATRVFFMNSLRETLPRRRVRPRSSTFARPRPASTPQIAKVFQTKMGVGWG